MVVPLVKRNVSQQSIDAIKAAIQPMVDKRLQTVDDFLAMLPFVDVGDRIIILAIELVILAIIVFFLVKNSSLALSVEKYKNI